MLTTCLYVVQLLGLYDCIDFERQRRYLLSTQSKFIGGFAKWTDTLPGNYSC